MLEQFIITFLAYTLTAYFPNASVPKGLNSSELEFITGVHILSHRSQLSSRSVNIGLKHCGSTLDMAYTSNVNVIHVVLYSML